jgi:purine nucleoside permease
MEDYATATVLRQFGYLDHYLSERWASDFDQAPPGMSTREGLSHFEGFFPGGINVFRVGLAVVDYIVEHWDVWKYGVPPPP